MNIFDGLMAGMGGLDMYRAQVVPEAYPDQKPMLVENWPVEDRLDYCGLHLRVVR